MKKNLSCPHCAHIIEEDSDFCPKCNKVLPIEGENYFTIFGLSEGFDINIKQLDSALFKLQMMFHPDKFINPNSLPAEKAISFNNSSIINQAYKTLKTPLQRAEYLLKLMKINIDEKEVPQKLLFESLEWRETLEESDNKDTMRQLLDDILLREHEAYKLLGEYFRKKLYNQASSIYIELKFYIRFKQEIINKLNLTNETI